jgi:peptidoglycan hydrolase-like protein with peptidoglycan-binding domain
LYRFLLERYPASDALGCYGDRAKTGQSSPSVHRDGRAFDIGFINDEAGRQACFNFLVDHHDALGVQMALNYARPFSEGSGRFWRLARYAGETAPTYGPFTKRGHWLHVEVHPTVALDETPVESLLGSVPAPGPSPTPPHEREKVMVNAEMEVVRRGDRGGFVAKAQAILTANFGQDLAADGVFGSKTDAAVRNVQTFFGLAVDGVVGPQTWTTLLEVAPG